MRCADFKFSIYIMILFMVLGMHACSRNGTGSGNASGVGSATFSIKWPDNLQTKQTGLPGKASSITTVDCATLGVASVSVIFTDSTSTALASGSWSCSEHTGLVEDIPAGLSYTVTVTARDAGGTDLYRGTQGNVSITAGQTTYIGTITLDPVSQSPNNTSNNTTTTPSGSFVATGSMNQQRTWNSATLLPDGKVLIVGGATGLQTEGAANTVYSSTELYDPSAGTFSYTGNLNVKRAWHTSDPGAPVTLLSNNMVLVTGGYDGTTTNGYYSSSELYNPITGLYSMTGDIPFNSIHHSSIPLPDGRVFIASSHTTYVAAIYDPSANTFFTAGSTMYNRIFHTATLLTDGRVLIAGGSMPTNQPTNVAELFNPETGAFTQTGSMLQARMLHRATLLPDGRVLITGGSTSYLDSNYMLSSAEIYDPSTGAFAQAGNMNYSRAMHSATLLLSGKVLLAGNWVVQTVTEIYDPSTGRFTTDATMIQARNRHNATLLPDGHVLFTGGDTRVSEIYVPTASPADTSAPTNPSVSINSGAASTSSRKVTLNLSARDDTCVTGYYVSELSTAPLSTLMTWIPVASIKSYSASVPLYLSTGSGSKTVSVWFKDLAGNVSAKASGTITLAP